MRGVPLALLLSVLAPALHAEPAPFWKGMASVVVPGSGQALRGDYGEAAAHLGLFGVSLYGALRQRDKDDFLDADARYDEDDDREIINKTTLRYDYAALTCPPI